MPAVSGGWRCRPGRAGPVGTLAPVVDQRSGGRLDALVAEATIDAYGDDEQLTGLASARAPWRGDWDSRQRSGRTGRALPRRRRDRRPADVCRAVLVADRGGPSNSGQRGRGVDQHRVPFGVRQPVPAVMRPGWRYQVSTAALMKALDIEGPAVRLPDVHRGAAFAAVTY
jgi:hypothetical protein